jgi:excisionase family DNA binding protein
MTKTAEQDYYTVAGTAAFLSVNPSTIWRWIKSGKLPAYRVGHKNIRIRKQDLAAVIQPAKGSEVSMDKEREALFAPPSQEELARRQQVVAQILANREKRVISPLSSADLVDMARKEDTWYGADR